MVNAARHRLGLGKSIGPQPGSHLSAATTVVAENDDGGIVGSICLVEHTFWYGDDAMLVDKWFYVAPEYRGKKVADELMGAAKQMARELDRRLMMGLATPRRLKAKMRLYRRWGFYLMGAHMLEAR